MDDQINSADSFTSCWVKINDLFKNGVINNQGRNNEKDLYNDGDQPRTGMGKVEASRKILDILKNGSITTT